MRTPIASRICLRCRDTVPGDRWRLAAISPGVNPLMMSFSTGFSEAGKPSKGELGSAALPSLQARLISALVAAWPR